MVQLLIQDYFIYKQMNLHIYISSRHFTLPAVVLQNDTNKGCLECVKSEKYVFLVTLRPLESMRQGEAELHTLHY